MRWLARSNNDLEIELSQLSDLWPSAGLFPKIFVNCCCFSEYGTGGTCVFGRLFGSYTYIFFLNVGGRIVVFGYYSLPL